MDLGSLELQIFVSLTVVLGGAFVALVCDYLKGNNEQLREHNIELRVRKEEQERRMLLDPAGFLSQVVPQQQVTPLQAGPPRQAPAVHRPAAVHEVMQSFASQEALSEADDRAAALHARSGDDEFMVADVPPMTARRGNRSNRKSNRNARRKNNESYADWVRPEIIARVARRAEASEVYQSDIREDIETVKAEAPATASPAPLNKAENWDIREELAARERSNRQVASEPEQPVPPAAPEPPTPVVAEATVPEPEPRLQEQEAAVLQKEIERVSQLERQPLAPAPGTILRPLTVPALKLEEELQRVSEETVASKPAASTAATPLWHSPLLDEVIAASANRAKKQRESVEAAAEAPIVPVAPLEVPVAPGSLDAEVKPIADSVELPPIVEFAPKDLAPAVVEEPVAPVEYLEVSAARGSETAPLVSLDAEVKPIADSVELPPIVEFAPTDLAPAVVEEPVAPVEYFAVSAASDLATAPLASLDAEVEPIADSVELPPVVEFASTVLPEDTFVGEPRAASEILSFYSILPHESPLAGAGILPDLDYLPNYPNVERPVARLPLSMEPSLLPDVEFATDEEIPALPELLPLAEVDALVEAPPLWANSTVAEELPVPIDISAARVPEPEFLSAPPPAPTHPDLLLPTGMHDFSTWARLLSLPNPMTGIVVVISLHNNDDSSIPDRKTSGISEEHAPAIDRLMAAFVREGDFGSRITDREWVFIYNNDVAGFNQRRVGMISEKLWDFQLRHLGLARITFRWGAIDVQREPLALAYETACERMNQTQRTRKLPGQGTSQPRQAVNA